MATKTTNLQLVKPEYTERADIQVINQNMNIIDAVVGANSQGKIDKPVGQPSGKFLKTGPNDTVVWGDAVDIEDIEENVEEVIHDWLEDNMSGTTGVNKTQNVDGAAADAKIVGDNLEEVRREVASLGDDAYLYTAIGPATTVTGWRLNEVDGLCSQDANYKLAKYTVTPGDVLKIVSDDRFQFQNSATVPASGANNRVGVTYIRPGDYVVKVPDTATHLILSTRIVSTASVKSGLSMHDNIESIIKVQDTQPVEEGNKLWARATPESELIVATYDDILDMQDLIGTKIDGTMRGVANGVATLNAYGKVPSSQLPNSSGSGINEQTRTALVEFFTQISALLPKLAYTVNNHNGTSVVLAANAVVASLTGTVAYSITRTLQNCSVSNTASEINEGDSYIAVVASSNGYTLNSVAVTMAGIDVTASAWNSTTSTIYISSATGDIVITASATRDTPAETYTITKTLSHCSLSNTATTVSEGGSYTSSLIASAGYSIGTVTITMNGVNITTSAWDSEHGTITIGNVTGKIVITATSTQNEYSVTKALSHCTLSNSAETVNGGTTYTSYLTPSSGYAISSVTVTMNGINITSTAWNNISGRITIANISGNIAITATAIESVVTHSVSKTLTHCSLANSATTVNGGSTYSSVLNVDAGYSVSSITIYMGGTDITVSAWDNATSTITIANVSGNIQIIATAATATYTQNVLYSNYTSTGTRFSKYDVPINFANGDYVEALIDATACTQDQENIFTVGKNANEYVENYNSAVAFMFYRRAQSGVNKILLRVKDVSAGVSIDKWVTPNNLAAVLIKIDSNGVSIDGNLISGITSTDIANLIGQQTYIVGARASKLTTAVYDHITVYVRD